MHRTAQPRRERRNRERRGEERIGQVRHAINAVRRFEEYNLDSDVIGLVQKWWPKLPDP